MATSPTRQPTRSWLRAAAALTVPPLTALLFVATPAAPAAASTTTPGPDSRPTTATSTGTTPTPCDPAVFPDCPAASPSIIVISPVPLQSPSPEATPSYLVGIPSPSVDPGINNGGTPIPLGGGFNDFPSPVAGGPVSAVSDNSGPGGPPLPLLLVGLLVMVGVAASILFALAPAGLRFPEPGGRARSTAKVGRSKGPELMVMHPNPSRQRPRGTRPKP